MDSVLQTLNLLASCVIVYLLWNLSDRLDPFRVHSSRPPPLKALNFFSRYMRRRAFKPIPHKRAEGPEVPLFRDDQDYAATVNYYVPKGEPDAEPFTAWYYPLRGEETPRQQEFRERMDGKHDPDTYVANGHVIPGPEFREVYEVAKIAVRLPRPQVRTPSYPPLGGRNGTSLTRPVHKVTIGTPVPEMTEEEARALAEEYELFDEPRPTNGGAP